jgi:hypothetical protein
MGHSPAGTIWVIVDDAVNNLLGYPHRQWRGLSRSIGASEREVAQALLVWRDEDCRERGGEGYWRALM